MRAFVAVRPPLDLAEELDEFLGPRRDVPDGPRWVRPGSWHVTLAFFGALPEDRADDLADAIEGCVDAQPPLTLALTGALTFPDVGRAKVLGWRIGGHDADGLERLATRIRSQANKHAVPADRTPFTAHLTAGRFRVPEDATRWVRVLDTMSWIGREWTVDRLALVRSEPQRRGNAARYADLAAWTLPSPVRSAR